MRSLIKLPLLMLLCCSAVEAVTANSAWAGDAGTTPPDSGGLGVEGGFAPGSNNNNANSNNGTPAAINAAIAGILESISGANPTIESPSGEVLELSQSQASVIREALTATGIDVQPAIAVLEQQLSAELGVLGIDLDIVGATPGNLTAAIASANAFINRLSPTERTAALRSPTFAALRLILDARRTNRGNDEEDLLRGGIPLFGGSR